MTPIIKWCGGKTNLLPELRSHAPASFRRYYEPFAGGLALFFALAPRAAVIADLNADLVAAYRAVAEHPDHVLRLLEQLRAGQCEAHYYAFRQRWNARLPDETPADRAAMFIYLNKTCFNGLWRVNKSGGMNTPWGKDPTRQIFERDNVVAAGGALSRAVIRHGDFKATTQDAGDGDFLYFDPPYDPLTRTANFTAYTKDGFGDDQQAALAEWARELRGRGARVMLSNNDTPLVRRLYHGFRVDVVRCPRAINSRGDKRGEIDEVIITGEP